MPAQRVRERRRPRSRRATYDAYLSSRAWSEKRKQWYAAWLTAAGVEPSCLVCGGRWTLKSGHLHHVTYARLGDEALEDLLPLCRRDHQALHAVIDAHVAWRRSDRRTATAAVIAFLRAPARPPPAAHSPGRPRQRMTADEPLDFGADPFEHAFGQLRGPVHWPSLTEDEARERMLELDDWVDRPRPTLRHRAPLRAAVLGPARRPRRDPLGPA